MLLEYIIYSYYIINITWFNLYYWEANNYSKYPLFFLANSILLRNWTESNMVKEGNPVPSLGSESWLLYTTKVIHFPLSVNSSETQGKL